MRALGGSLWCCVLCVCTLLCFVHSKTVASPAATTTVLAPTTALLLRTTSFTMPTNSAPLLLLARGCGDAVVRAINCYGYSIISSKER